MGVIDEFDVLEKEEVFVMTRIDGIYAPITGQVLVAKNPCLHPGDIRLVTAVDRKELYHMRDVLIFSKRGKRPIFNMCSGSDLDGDLYFCSWEPRLIPPKTYTADNYISSCHLYKTVVSMTDIVNFFIKFMRDNELGSIANAHLAFSDQKIRGVTAPESLKLATLFNMGVDFPKTGFVARLPLDLTPTIYPDFMNIKGQPSYKSTKTLGVLYRRSKMLKFNILSLCDCINCISKCFLNELKVLVNGLVILEKRGFRNENKFNENEQNSRIKSQNNNHPSNQNNNNQNKDCNENYNDEEAQRFSFFNYDPLFYNSIQNSHLFKNVTTYMDEAWEIYNEYTTELSSLMNRYGYTSEEELFLGYVQENDILTFEENRNTQKSINERVKAFIRKYREKFLKNSHGENLLTKMMAWYKVSHSSCGNGSSFPWILDIFQKHAIKEVPDKTDSLENEWEKAFKRRNIRYEEFIFNPNVIFVDENARSILGDVDEHNVKSNEKSDEFNHENKIGNNSQNRKTVVQYKFRTGNKIQNALIFVFGDFSANVQLRKAKDQKVLIELFHLLFSIQFYKIDELEDAIVFILKIMNETNDYPKILIRNYISQRLFSLSKASVGQCYSEDERNKLITIASLIFIDIPLLSKMKILRQQLKEDGHNEWMAARERNFNSDKPDEEQCIYSSNKIHQSPFHGISIRGQFDPNDEVYFTLVPGSRDNERKVYYLNLLNEGTADVDFYKDDLRKFLLGHIWHHKENQSVVLIRIIPGQLLFYSLISKFAYNNLKINELSKYMYAARNKNVIKKEFMNVFFKNECFLKDEIERRFENIGIKDFARNNFELLESAEYELALQKGNKRYGIYFRGPRICGDDKNSVRDKNERNPVRNRKNRNSVRGKDDKNLKKNGDGSDEEMTEKENNFNISKTGIKPFLVSPMEVEKITKRRFVCGRYEIVDTKNRNDFMIETLFEDIIYHASRNYSNLENHERFMIVNKMLKFENGEFVVDTGDFDFLRFEINVRLQQIGSFTAYKQFIFKMKDKRLAVDKTHIRVYNERMYFLEDINGHLEFERCFEKVWLSYLEGMETFSRKKEIE